MTVHTLHHVALAVRDLERAAAFYRAACGFTIISEGAGGVFLQAPTCQLELMGVDAPEPAPRPVNEAGITHFCLQARHMDALHAQFADAGASFHAVPLDLGTGNLYVYARDPEGNVVELEALPDAPPEREPWIAHVALSTPNVERLAAFYHRLLGGTRLGGQKLGPNPRYDQVTGLTGVEVIPTWIVGGNVSVELWQYLQPPTLPVAPRSFGTPGYSHICFAVENVAVALAACVEAGATPEPQMLAFVRDPDGNLLELRQADDPR